MQNYWVPREQGNEPFMLPLTYHIRRNRWFPGEDSFLNLPDDQPSRVLRHWNSNCIRCHSVAGNPGLVESDPPEDRVRSREAVRDLWGRDGARSPVGPDPALLLTPDGTIDPAILDRLTRQRNDRPVVIPE